MAEVAGMALSGNELADQAEMITRAATAQSRVADATRVSPGRVHRETPRAPAAGTVARVTLAVIVAAIVLGWILTALNS
jgi:hypothetical protein